MPENELLFTEYMEELEEGHHEEDLDHAHRLLSEAEHSGHAHSDFFPLPNAMAFLGLLILLVNDKVLFSQKPSDDKKAIATSSEEKVNPSPEIQSEANPDASTKLVAVSYSLLVGLCLHSLIEGLAVGL